MAAKSPIENLTAAQQVQFFYVTFYGRPADPAGLAFWTDAVTKNGILNVVKDFGNSVESASLYGSLTTREKIAKMYLTTFGREADSGGLDYWTGLVTNGTIPNFAQAVVHMYNAMAPVDQTAVQNRQTVADEFTALIASSPLLKAAFTDPATSGKAGQTLATWMASVSADPSSVTAAQANTTSVITNIALGNANKASPAFGSPVLPTITEDGGMVSGKVVATDADNIPTVTQKLAYELVGSASSKGNAVSINAATGDFTYTPAANFNGADSFTVAVSDGAGGRTVKTIDLNVVAVNDAPKIAADSVSTALATSEDVAKTGSITATDVDGDKLTYAVATQGGKGTVVIDAATGKYTYTPAADKNGTDSFVLTVSDGKAADSITVNVAIAAVNDAPKLTADSVSTALSTNEDVAKSGSIAATDVDGDTVTYAVATQGTKGSVVIDAATGKYTYTPAADKNGADSFVLTASDGKAADSITVNVAIAAVNDAPKIAADSVSTSLSTSEDVSKAGSITASDVDGDKLTYAVASQGSIGSVSIDAATGKYTYTPSANKNGVDSFVLTASDGNGGADSITVNVTVTAVNDAPKIADSVATSLSTSEDVTKAGSITATDIEGDTITYAVGSQGKIGTVSVDASTGVYTYAPAADKNGTDSFVLTASDGKGGADSITVNVTVAAVNDAPKITADSVSTALATTEDTAKAGSIKATDVDGDSLTYAVASQGKLGTVSIDSATGSYTYTPKANENGSDSFVLSASDGKGGADSITVNVTIAAVNDAPVAADDTATVVGGNSVAVSVLANDKDADNDKLTIVSAVSTRGNVTINTDGTLTYKAMDGDGSPTGIPDSVIYTVSDGKGGTASATLTVNVVTRTGGSSGNDVLGGGTGNDIINALEGDDFVNGGGGLDRITAGDGNDTVVFSDEANFIRGGNDTDTLKLPVSGDFKFDLNSTTNQYTGAAQNINKATVVVSEFEIIDGSAAQSGITASAATAGSTVYGSSMADSLVGAAGNDYFDGGRGNDTLIGGGGVDTIYGGSGADSILGAGFLYGDSGADSITTSGAATVSGGGDNDYIVAGGSGSIVGGGDNDVVLTSGNFSGLTIDGGDGNDSIYSASSADSLSLYGGSGADTISVDGLNDFVNGGDGNDYIALSTTSLASTASIHGGSGVDTLVLADSVIGTSAADFTNISGFESIIFGYTAGAGATVGGGNYTLNGNSVTAGLADLTTITIGGADSVGDSITLRNISQPVTINVKESYDAAVTSIDADSTTGSIVVVADSLGITDVLSLHGANDYFRDTVDGNTSYVFASGSGVEFIELTGKAVNATAAVSIVSGQSLSFSDAAGDSVSLTVGLTNGGSGTADTVTISGGSRSDVIDLTGVDKATVYGGNGNDSIYIPAGQTGSDSVLIYGGSGADTIYAGKWDIVYGDDLVGGSGDDLIILSYDADSTTAVDGGAGNDVVRFQSATTSVSETALARLTSIEGLDFTGGADLAVTLSGATSALFNTIYVDGDSVTLAGNYGGTGNIAITLTNGSVAGDTVARIIADSLSDLVITANGGIDADDTIDAGLETSPTATLDIITATVGKADTAVSFALNYVDNIDQLNIGRLSGATSVATVTVTAADSIAVTLTSVAADSLSLNLTAAAGGMVTVTGGAGNDLINLSSATKGNRYVETESISSADTVLAAQAGDSVSDYISAGAGSDSILIDARDSVYAGAGNDTIISTVASGQTAGADSLDVLMIYADSGSDWISIDGAYDYVDAGDGDDRIVLTSTKVGLSASIIGGAGSDTLSLAADSTGLYADSAFTNVHGIEVLDLRNSGNDAVTLGAEADQAGIIRVLADAADSITLVGMGPIQIDAAVSGGNGAVFRLISDSLSTVTLFADSGAAFGSEDIIQLSTVTGGDVLSIRGAASDSIFDLLSDRGIDSIIVRGDVTRTVQLSNVGSDSLGGLIIEAADTAVTLNVVVSGADSLRYTVMGNAGSDSVTATSGTLSVMGGAGADSVVSNALSASDYIDVSGGTSAADSDYVSAGSGNDTIITGAGNDTVHSGTGADSISAGSGDDLVVILGSTADSVTRDYVSLGDGADSLLVSGTAGIGVDVYMGTGADTLTLSNKADFVYVDAADTNADVISADSGSDYIDLRTTVAVSGTNVVDLGADSDQFLGGPSADSVHGQAGNDIITTGAGADTVYGGAGDDSISVGLTAATAGDSNYASGDAGNDTIIGGGLNDTLDGGSGNDSISAGGGADSVHVGTGLDWVDAGDGNDIVVVPADGFDSFAQAGTGLSLYDTLKGGSGSADTLSASFSGDTTLGALTTFNNNLANVSEFEVVSVANTTGTTTFYLNDTLLDSSITLAFTGAASVSLNSQAVTETGTVRVTADTAVAGLTLTGSALLTEIVEIYASDSLDGDLRFTGGTGSDKVVVLGQTQSGTFDFTDVTVPLIELRGDTDSPFYNLAYGRTPQVTASMTVSVTGGVGADTTGVTWSSSGDSIAISFYGSGGNDSIFTGGGADYISVGLGANTVSSGAGADTIVSGSGASSVNAGSGDDSIVLGSGSDTVYAEAGNDVIWLGDGTNIAILGSGRDTIYGGSGADSVDGTGDSLGDYYYLYAGSDSVFAGSGADIIDVSGSGAADSDYVSAGDGSDSVSTGDGNDTVVDGAGTDSIWTGSGNDSVYLTGTDTSGVDYIYLGTGSDTLNGSADSGGLVVSIDGGSGADVILTGAGNDSIFASVGADSIDAGAGRDTIYAQGMNNVVADTISDTVTGGFGADWIDLGLSSVGDTDYLIFFASTLASGDITNQTLAANQHSSYVTLDTIVNFDPYSSLSAESVSFDVFNFDMTFGSGLADSIANDATYVKDGLLIGDAFDAVSAMPSNSTLASVVGQVESWLGSSLTQGEVVAFQWSNNWYVAVAIANSKIGSVVHFAGVDIDKLDSVTAGIRIIDDPGV